MTNELTTHDLVWAAPGPGRWEGERAHADASCTPLVQHLMATGMQRGLRTVFTKFGVPLETMDARYVNGQLYTRLRPLIGADKVKP